MGLVSSIEVRPISAFKGGMAEFYTPQSSHETMMVQIPPNTIDDLYVHHFQTDQLLVVRGSFVLISLQNRAYRYFYLSDRYPTVVTIPPGIPHSAINLSPEPCVLVNAVLRHGTADERDYRPMRPPIPYDMAAIARLMAAHEYPLSA
jgi:hypothetical protein